ATRSVPALLNSQSGIAVMRSSPSNNSAEVVGREIKWKSNAYLSGIRNTYFDRHYSIGGNRINRGDPPGKARPSMDDGMPVVCCDDGYCPNDPGRDESTVKSRVVENVATWPAFSMNWFDGGGRLVRTSVPSRTARIRHHSGSSGMSATFQPACWTYLVRRGGLVATDGWPKADVGNSCSSMWSAQQYRSANVV